MADPVAIIRQYLDAWNRRDWDAFRAALHPTDYTYMGGDGVVQRGVDAGVAVGQTYATAFPDGRLDITRALSCQGNVALIEFTVTGTHTGPLLGIAPTGKRVSLPVCNVAEIRDDKIVNEHEYLDSLAMFVQLGVVNDPTAAGV
ncbi:MAG: ester cyclase [Dehalococcoidia bacterium]